MRVSTFSVRAATVAVAAITMAAAFVPRAAAAQVGVQPPARDSGAVIWIPRFGRYFGDTATISRRMRMRDSVGSVLLHHRFVCAMPVGVPDTNRITPIRRVAIDTSKVTRMPVAPPGCSQAQATK